MICIQCLTVEEVERLLNEHVAELSQELKISPSLAKMLLHAHQWTKDSVVTRLVVSLITYLLGCRVDSIVYCFIRLICIHSISSYRLNKEKLLIETGITPSKVPPHEPLGASLLCQVGNLVLTKILRLLALPLV